ncbi:MAG: metalloregulator ArsR/SmtB family transcription factor [Eubacteriales bacterium]|nr:metalloregulator ArsR/SmtB family transcription factor [Eubacteriales bacterium]
MDLFDVAAISKALSDDNRLKIVLLLADGEKCACKLLEAFDISQPTLSHHMKTLCACGLVLARKDGKWNHYSLNCHTLNEFAQFVAGLSCGSSKKGCGCR